MTLGILHQDDLLVAVSKPGGLLVHRTPASRDTLFLLQLLRDQLGGDWLYPIHRLDRAASGVMIFGRSPEAAKFLQAALSAPDAVKTYLALVRGTTREKWEIDRPLTCRETRKKQLARTSFERVREIPIDDAYTLTLVRARIHTGRRHQIRRHLAHTKNHILGDTTYGKGRINRHFREKFGLPRMFLHCARLEFDHPGGSGRVAVRAPLAEDGPRPCLPETASRTLPDLNLLELPELLSFRGDLST